ncbi:MAG: lipoyl synthase [Dehalococcoidia bacterium]|nr:lipoyl synthase [Dehalococcoidia bacterium]
MKEGDSPGAAAPRRLPGWLKVRAPGGPNYLRLQALLRRSALHTVCEEAGCPNIGECFESGTATFLILGDVCTRACRFCGIRKGRPAALDGEEPRRVAETVRLFGLRHAVVTSVTRDDLPDGGASVFAAVIDSIREVSPGTTVEVLVPDFRGDQRALTHVLEAHPDILNHNVETVPRLYREVRPQAHYTRSLELLRRSRESGALTKSGLMVGLGESREELREVFGDLRAAGCDVLTIGQYLRPGAKQLPVVRFYPPAEFDELRREAEEAGFLHVESGPLVRSSYHAASHLSAVPGGCAP